MRLAGVVQVRDRRTRRAQHAQHVLHGLGAEAENAGADRFACHPAAQISGATTAPLMLLPVVIGGGHRRMIVVSERARLGKQPRLMGRIWRGNERERTSERVDDLLRMPGVGVVAACAPSPTGRELPQLQMRGNARRARAVRGFSAAHHA